MKILFALFAVFTALITLVNAETQTAVSSNFADVSAAVAAASRGDTVIVPAGTGSVTWSSTLTLTKGVFLSGPGCDLLTITAASQAIVIQPDATAITNEETIRIEGFTFDGNGSAGTTGIIRVFGAGVTSRKPFKNLAIGHNRFQNMATHSTVIYLNGQNRGAIFNNIFNRCDSILRSFGNDDTTEWSNGHYPFAYGNSDNLFFEGNTIQFSSSFGGVESGWNEIGQGARVVMRYNTWDYANELSSSGNESLDVHGFQNYPSNGQTGTMITEFYGNTISNSAGNRAINLRGGWGLFYNNVITGKGINYIQINQYGPSDTGGSGCTPNVPGATGVYNSQVNNTYAFNNTVGGALVNIIRSSLIGCGVSENTDYWNYNASFDGTSGIGRGTTAPTGNCKAGAAYWVASTPTPTTNPNVIQSGKLYKCLAENVWTAYYTPYIYPHPLASRSPSPPPPQRLRVVAP
jgi:hypothetical protein